MAQVVHGLGVRWTMFGVGPENRDLGGGQCHYDLVMFTGGCLCYKISFERLGE